MTSSSLRHVNLHRLRQIAETEFADIVVDVWIPDVNTMRICCVMIVLSMCGIH